MTRAAKRSTVMSIIQAYSGKDNVIPIPRVYVKMCGDFNRAAVLNQILYWSERTSDPDGWFYKSYEEWDKELGLSRYQIKRAIEGDARSKDNSQALASMGVEFDLRKAPNGAPTVHYRIDEKVFIQALTAAIKVTATPILNNVENGNVNIVENASETMLQMDVEQCCSSFNTEITTETTTENKELSASSNDAQSSPPDEEIPFASWGTPKEPASNGAKEEQAKAPAAVVKEYPATADEWKAYKAAVCSCFEVAPKRANNIMNMLLGRSKANGYKEYNLATPLKLDQMMPFKHWYKKQNPGADMVKSPEKINDYVTRFQDEQKQRPQLVKSEQQEADSTLSLKDLMAKTPAEKAS